MDASRPLAALVAVALVGAAPDAFARGSARLSYVRPAVDVRCPDEATLRSMVSTQLGYDPFDDGSSTHVEASIERSGGRLRGRVVVRRAEEAARERVLDAGNDCASLATALALTVAVAVDTLEAGPESLPPLPPLPPPPPPPPPPRAPDLPARPAPYWVPPAGSGTSRPVLVRLSAAPIASYGIAPAIAPGGAVSVGMRWAALSLGLEGRFDLPASAHLSTGGEVSTSLWLAMLVPCAHPGPFAVCAVGGVGRMHGGSSGVVNAAEDDGAVGVAGARLGIELPLSHFVALRPQLDVLAAIGLPKLQFDGGVIWKADPVSGTLGLAAVIQPGGGGF